MPMFILLLSAAAAMPVTPPPAAYRDEHTQERDGTKRIVRTAQWSDLDGGLLLVEQKLRLNPDDSLSYFFSEQSLATQLYHHALCEQDGMTAGQGEGILSGPDAIGGWSCEQEGDGDLPVPRLEQDPGSKSSSVGTLLHGDRSADYVFAYAPSGNVGVGENFRAHGSVRFRTTRAGNAEALIGVDNRRCVYRVSRYYSAGTTGSFAPWVNCIIHVPTTVPTEAVGCIPWGCATDRGRVVAY